MKSDRISKLFVCVCSSLFLGLSVFGYSLLRPSEAVFISNVARSHGDDSSALYMKYFAELRRYVFTNFNSSDFTIHNWNLTSDYTAWDRWTVAGYSMLSSIAYEKSGDVKYLFEAKFFVDGLLSKVDSSSQSIIIYPYKSPPRYGWLFADCDWIWAMQKLNEHLKTSYNVTDRVDKILTYAVENSTDLWWRYNYVTGTENYMTPNTYSHMLGLLAYLTNKGVKDYSSELQKLYYSHEKSRTSNGLYSYNYPPLGTGTVHYTTANVFGLLVGYKYHPSVFNATKIQETLDYYASYNNYAQVHWVIPADAGMYALGTSLGFNVGDRLKNAFLRMYNQFDVGGANATNRNLERGMFWTGTFTKVFVWYFSATMPLPALAFVDAFVIPTMTYSATESSNTWYLSNSWNNDSEIWFDHGAGGSPFWTALRMKLFSNEFLDAVDTSGSSLLDLSSVTANGTHYRATATGTNPSAYTVNLAQDFSARQFQICFNTTNSATYIKYHWYNYTANPCFMTVFFPNGTSVDINTNGTYTLDNCFVIELHNQKWRFIKTDNRTFTFTKLLGGTSYNQLKTQAKSFLIYRFDLYRATTSTTVETWFQNALEYFNQHGKTGLQEPINTSNINPYLVSSGIEDSIMLFSQGSIGSISGIAYNWNTLSFTVTASSGTTSTIQVYCGFQSEPTNVQGAMSWNYNSETKIVTINVLHASSKEIIIYFAEHDPPTTDISLNGVLGNNNWFISEVTVTLSATDDISGVSKTEYSFDNTTWITYTTPITITNEGNTTVYYRSTDNANNTETIKTETLKIDETTPSGSIIVNNGDAYTTSTSVMLTLTASDATSDVYQVIYSNDGVWDTESWENPSPTRTWTLTSGDGTKTVYCQIKDNAGLISSVYSDTIILDTTSPTGTIKINDDAIYTTTTSVTLILSATDTTSEVAEMCFSNDNITYTDWQAYATSKSWTLQDRDGTKTIYVQFRDQAGSISTYTDTIILDTVRPTGFLVIAGGATYTNSTSVNHALSADDETSGVAQMRFSHDNTTWASWETYSTSKAWELTTNDGTKIVYVQFMDNAGLISLTSQDSILLDTTKPTASAVVDQTMSVGTTMVFDAGDSTDNMNIVSFEWDFGDGTTATGITATHTYTNYGSFTVTLTVKDAAGNSDTDLITFSVPSSPATEFPMWKIGAIVATISIGIIATLLLRKRKCVRMRASSESFCLNNKPSVPTVRNGENLNLRGI